MKLRILFITAAFFLTSCATMYQPVSFFHGGYSEIVTSQDSFYVTFKANQCTSNDKVMKYALRRASELTIKNGYDYFVINSSVDNSSYTNYISKENSASKSNDMYFHRHSSHSLNNKCSTTTTTSGIICRPAITLKIKCYKTPPKDEDAIDARYYLANNAS